jgi:hypothetical protein
VPFRRVGKIQFSVWNPEELKGYSVTQKMVRNSRPIPAGIFTHESYRDGEPVDGGLADPRMGNTIDKDNPGYFGHIELARPVYHVGFMNTVLSILRCVSLYDGKMLFQPEDDQVSWDKACLLDGATSWADPVRTPAVFSWIFVSPSHSIHQDSMSRLKQPLRQRHAFLHLSGRMIQRSAIIQHLASVRFLRRALVEKIALRFKLEDFTQGYLGPLDLA